MYEATDTQKKTNHFFQRLALYFPWHGWVVGLFFCFSTLMSKTFWRRRRISQLICIQVKEKSNGKAKKI